jgi:hypothetical protein
MRHKMKHSKIFTVLTAVASMAAAPLASADDVTCASANFSQNVLDTFGSIRYACREIVQRNGEPHALLRAEVVRANAPKLTVRFQRTDDGKLTNPVTITPAEDYIFTLDSGKKLKLRELSAGNVLRVYVPVSAPIGKVGFVIDPMTGAVTYFEIDPQ